MFGMGVPSFVGVWHSWQLAATFTRYSPRASGVVRAGGAALAAFGVGIVFTIKFSGKMSFVFGNGFFTGGIVRRYATIDSASSSSSFAKFMYGMTGKSARPSLSMPS